MQKKIQTTPIMFSIIIILAAQVNMNLFISNFKISIGIIMFSLFLMLTGKYPIIPVTLLSAAGVYISRIAVYWFHHAALDSSLKVYFPELLFYIIYGTVFWLYCRSRDYEWNRFAFPIFFLLDYISNLAELLLRLGAGAFTGRNQLSILLVAAIRTTIIWCLYLVLQYYKFSLLRREHAQRYQRLLILISKLNGEVIWMKKNTGLIEETMNISYKLYQDMMDQGIDESLSKKALSVAKDIHEIKKEYALILRGLSDAMELNLNDEGMYLEDIFQVLKNSLTSSETSSGRKLDLDIRLCENLYTRDHYFLMSVFRNLFNNAIEASRKQTVSIKIRLISDGTNWLFTVADDGPGIAPEDLGEIFRPGFSTKINYDTGEINRGLGLNLVQDLIVNHWEGHIDVQSRPGETIFSISIPKEQWRGTK